MRKILLSAVLAFVALPAIAGVPKYDAQGRTVVAGEPSAAPVPISGTITTTPSGTQDTNLKQVNGAAVNVGTGAAGTGTQRVTTSTDSSLASVGSITNALPAGTNLLGKVGIDQTTPGTTNGVVVNSSALPTGASTATNQTAPQATPGSDASKAFAVQGVTGGKAVAVDGSGVTQPISATSLPLPSGAATASAQSTAQTSLSSLVTNTTGLSTAANQTTVQATAGSDASKAIAVQGVTGAKAIGTSVADGSDVTLGAQADVACSTDNGTCTLEALIKRLNQRLTTLNTTLGSPFQAGGSIGNSTFGATQSGTWTVQPGNTANTTAWKVDGSAVTQPVSGTVTANAGTNLNTSALALDATLGTTNTDLGAPGATACATDTGSCSLNALAQRVAQRLTTLNTTLGTPLQAGGNVAVTSSALPSGAATSAKQPALGTTVTPSTDFVSNQAEGVIDSLVVSNTASSATTIIGPQDTTGYQSVHFEILSAASASTFVAEVSTDNSTWHSAFFTQISGQGQQTAVLSTQSANAYSVGVTAKWFRIRISNYVSGTASVVANFRKAPLPSQAVSVAGVNLPSSGTDGASNSTAGLLDYARVSLFNGSTWDRAFTCANTASVNVTAGNTTQIVGLSGSTVIRVCSVSISMSATGTASFLSGTGTNCGTPSTIMTAMNLNAGVPWQQTAPAGGSLFRSTAGGEICVAAVTGDVTGVISYAQF